MAAVRRMVHFARGHMIAIAYLILAAGLLFYAYRLEQTADQTNKIVKQDLADRDAQIAAATFVITQQAVPAIKAMQQQIRTLGDIPPDVLLNPSEPSFAEQQK